jgi:flagellar protein FlaG
MNTEINSLLNSLRPLSQDQPVSAAGRVPRSGQPEAVRPVADPRSTEDPSKRDQEKKSGTEDSIEGAVSDLNVLAQQMRRELQFSVEEDSGELVVKVIDKETDEVVRQIPPEVLLELRKRMTEAAGAIFSDSV